MLFLRFLPIAALGACASLRGTEPSTVSTSQNVLSAYWFRGVPRSLEPVTQGDLEVDTPLALGGNLSFVAWYSMQLTNRTGEAAFPDGHGGESTEIDLALDYTQSFGPVRVSGGGVSYQYPEVAPSTKEAYLSGALEAFGLSHALSAHYDLDLLDDFYLSYQASKVFAFDARWSATLAVLLGYMRDGQGEFYFGESHSGFSDLLLTGSLTYTFDENTSVFLRVAGVTVPDDELAAAAEENQREDSGFWVELAAAWGL